MVGMHHSIIQTNSDKIDQIGGVEYEREATGGVRDIYLPLRI